MIQLSTAEQALSVGDVAAARAAINQAVQMAPHDPAVQVMAARVTIAEGDSGLGEQQLRKVLAKAPSHLGAAGTLGALLVGLDRHLEGGPLLERAVLGGMATPSIKLAYGRYLASIAQLPRAILFFQQVVSEAPNAASAHFFLALALADTGKTFEAQNALIQVVKLEPQDVTAWGLLVSLQARASVDAAMATLAEARKHNPDDVSLWRVAAQALSEAGRAPEALAQLEQIGADRRSTDDWCNIAWLTLAARQGAAAIAAATAGLATDEANPRAHYMMGLALESEATLNRPRIERHYRRAVELGDPSGEAATRLGLLLIEEGAGQAPRSAEAVELLEAARGRSADAPATLWHLALALRQVGRTAEAKSLAQTLVSTPGVPSSLVDQARRLATS
jgi:cellulose synthase operon protein C